MKFEIESKKTAKELEENYELLRNDALKKITDENEALKTELDAMKKRE